MFQTDSNDGFRTAAQGVQMKTLVFGSQTLMAKFRLQKGSTIPHHTHPHEQTGTLLSGHMRLTIGDQVHEVKPGDSWCIAGDLEHGVEVLADSVAVEVFAPVREDYLP